MNPTALEWLLQFIQLPLEFAKLGLMKLILIGDVVAGEQEIQKQLAVQLKLPEIRMADLFRRAVLEETELGLHIKHRMASGETVEDSTILALLNDRLKTADSKEGFVLSGFPKTVSQLKLFQDFDHGVFLDIPAEFFVHQFMEQHAHGKPELFASLKETVTLRFRHYTEAMAPLLSELESEEKLLRIPAADEVSTVVQRIMKQLKK
ncbi:MAG: nucleoside monophosphate kinase [Planctomycetota bacterium]|nr:nucleoside monophosphate kinase [Planctomycetota bacterium]